MAATVTDGASDVTFEEIRAAQAQFAAQRDWDQYHTPRNLLIALVRGAGRAWLIEFRDCLRRVGVLPCHRLFTTLSDG